MSSFRQIFQSLKPRLQLAYYDYIPTFATAFGFMGGVSGLILYLDHSVDGTLAYSPRRNVEGQSVTCPRRNVEGQSVTCPRRNEEGTSWAGFPVLGGIFCGICVAPMYPLIIPFSMTQFIKYVLKDIGNTK